MGEFVYLFGGIEKKRPVDRELNFHVEMDRRIDRWNGQEQTVVPKRDEIRMPGFNTDKIKLLAKTTRLVQTGYLT